MPRKLVSALAGAVSSSDGAIHTLTTHTRTPSRTPAQSHGSDLPLSLRRHMAVAWARICHQRHDRRQSCCCRAFVAVEKTRQTRAPTACSGRVLGAMSAVPFCVPMSATPCPHPHRPPSAQRQHTHTHTQQTTHTTQPHSDESYINCHAYV